MNDSNSENESKTKPTRQDKGAAIHLLTDEIVEKWTREQMDLKKRLQLFDKEPWQINRQIYAPNKKDIEPPKSLRYVAGMDISFVKNDTLACSGLFVFDLTNNMELVYLDLDNDELINMDQPYVPGFLAYREAPFLLKKLDKLKKEKPWFYPQCIFIDGNGVLHANGFGMACHIGLLSDTPTIGCSKKLFQVLGLENNQEHKDKIKSVLKHAGDCFELRSNDAEHTLLGFCYKPTEKSSNPIYVSIGHKISWETCLWLLKIGYGQAGWNYRIPEPIRQADLLTREYLRNFL